MFKKIRQKANYADEEHYGKQAEGYVNEAKGYLQQLINITPDVNGKNRYAQQIKLYESDLRKCPSNKFLSFGAGMFAEIDIWKQELQHAKRMLLMQKANDCLHTITSLIDGLKEYEPDKAGKDLLEQEIKKLKKEVTKVMSESPEKLEEYIQDSKTKIIQLQSELATKKSEEEQFDAELEAGNPLASSKYGINS